MSEEEKEGKDKGKTSFLFKLGIALIMLSFSKWVIGIYVPFLHYTDKEKLAIITVLFVIAEITFWIGVFLVGEETYKKYKYYFNPVNWFKKAAKEVLEEEKKELQQEKTEDMTNKEEIRDPNYKEDR